MPRKGFSEVEDCPIGRIESSFINLQVTRITCWHLADWIAKETGNTKKAVRNDIDKLCAGLYLLAGDLANGQKHWQRDGSNPPQSVAKTSAPGARRRLSPIGLAMNYRETPFVIDNNGRKIYAQILIRDTLDAIEKHMKSLGLV